MSKPRTSLFLAILLGLSILSGCASLKEGAGLAGEGKLSNQAVAALAQAESDVRAARAAFTLWTTAEDALNKALEAARAGNSPLVIEQAALVSSLCKLSAAQAAYPSTELK